MSEKIIERGEIYWVKFDKKSVGRNSQASSGGDYE